MLRIAAVRGLRGLRPFSTAPPLREPGVVGLTAGPDPRKDLSDTYNATLAAVAELPESAAYRVNVEKITRHRLGVVEGTEDVEELENKLGLGRIEEVMEQAQDELDLIPHMARWEPWKVAEGKPPVKIELID